MNTHVFSFHGYQSDEYTCIGFSWINCLVFICKYEQKKVKVHWTKVCSSGIVLVYSVFILITMYCLCTTSDLFWFKNKLVMCLYSFL